MKGKAAGRIKAEGLFERCYEDECKVQKQVEGDRYKFRADQGCSMILWIVMRLVGSTTKILSSRSLASAERAPTLSAMKGDSLQFLFTSCSLHKKMTSYSASPPPEPSTAV